MSEVPKFDRRLLPLVPTYQAVLGAGIGGLPLEIVRLSGDSGQWANVVAEAKKDPFLIDLLSGVRVTGVKTESADSEQIYHFLRGLSLAGKIEQDLSSGLYRITPEAKVSLYWRNMARLTGCEEQIEVLSTRLAKLAA